MKFKDVKPGLLLKFTQENIGVVTYIFLVGKTKSEVNMLVVYIKPSENLKFLNLGKSYWDSNWFSRASAIKQSDEISRRLKKRILKLIFKNKDILSMS